MKKPLVISLISLIALAAAGAGAYFMFFTTEAQAQRIADSTIQAAVNQQEASFKANGAPENSDAFYSAAAQRNYRLSNFTQDGDTYYALYLFTDEQSPLYARIAVSSGSVSAFSTGDKLGAVPAKDGEEDVASIDSDEFCLSRDDLAFIDSKSLYARKFRAATMIFANDTTTEYAGQENGKRLLDRIANFYDKSSTKDYSFIVQGYLIAKADTVEQRTQVTQNRATKIQQELVDRGVSEDRISIEEPLAYPEDRPIDSANERYINIEVVNNCNS
ncbi:MAG: hypothetical protein UY35_C0012G0018 [Candidatus Saccharibacteria bacterium GW2011_GWC2_48_9]|nr:MAG: hypothetical protein UY35_C0012G0018 [Candidatus Saccharibacteria bacterium GW2011_GWC2_48_9]HCH34326.1 hypothetical protein [Candidatus Saccharibacteria bacterium]